MSYCPNCGAEVVRDRITGKKLWRRFALDFFGWDNKFLLTLKLLLWKPEQVLGEYVQGVRKRYLAPFVFLAIGTALTMLVFNQLEDEYIKMAQKVSEGQLELLQENFAEATEGQDMERFKKVTLESNLKTQRSVLKYFNILIFLMVPVNALIALWAFGAPFNYGEHLVINCYLQGVVSFVNAFLFVASVLIDPAFYFLIYPLMAIYYVYAYARLNAYGIRTLSLKVLKLSLLVVLFPLALFIVGLFAGLVTGLLTSG